ncbi:MAG: glutamine synthetase [Myxococcota bacterium]
MAVMSPGGAREGIGSAENGMETQARFPPGRLERWLQKPSSQWTVDDLIRVVKERGIPMVTLIHVGGDGWLKTLDFVPHGAEHLRDVLEGGERADGSSLFKGMGIPVGASDIVLRPRIETAFIDPFSPVPALALRCGHVDRQGAPLPQSPDTLVHRAHRRAMSETGVDLHALGEVEFFVGRKATENDVYGGDDRGYHATAPMVFGESLRRQAMALLAEMGAPMKYGHSEVGYIEESGAEGLIWEQHEIELALAPLPDAADWVVLTQWVLRHLAHRAGMQVSFDPIVRQGNAGTGLHFHFSPHRDGRSTLVQDESGAWLEPSRWLVGGLVRLGGALMAFGNRTEYSYVRLTQGKEAPSRILWGQFDRHALVRLPVSARTAEGRCVTTPTVEFRLPDGSAHPHLLLAGAAQALVHGKSISELDALLERTASSKARESGDAGVPLPLSPKEVAAALREHRSALEAGEVFPSGLLDSLAVDLAG